MASIPPDFREVLIDHPCREARLAAARKIGWLASDTILDEHRLTSVLNDCSLKVRSHFFRKYRGFLPGLKFHRREIRFMSRMYCRPEGDPGSFAEIYGYYELHFEELGRWRPDWGLKLVNQCLLENSSPYTDLQYEGSVLMWRDFRPFFQALDTFHRHRDLPLLDDLLEDHFSEFLCEALPHLSLVHLLENEFPEEETFDSLGDNSPAGSAEPSIKKMVTYFAAQNLEKWVTSVYGKLNSECQHRVKTLLSTYLQGSGIQFFPTIKTLVEKIERFSSPLIPPSRKSGNIKAFLQSLLHKEGTESFIDAKIIWSSLTQGHWAYWLSNFQKGDIPVLRSLLDFWKRAKDPQGDQSDVDLRDSGIPRLSRKNRRRLGVLLGILDGSDFELALSLALVNTRAYESFKDNDSKVAHFRETFSCDLACRLFMIQLYPKDQRLRDQILRSLAGFLREDPHWRRTSWQAETQFVSLVRRAMHVCQNCAEFESLLAENDKLAALWGQMMGRSEGKPTNFEPSLDGLPWAANSPILRACLRFWKTQKYAPNFRPTSQSEDRPSVPIQSQRILAGLLGSLEFSDFQDSLDFAQIDLATYESFAGDAAKLQAFQSRFPCDLAFRVYLARLNPVDASLSEQVQESLVADLKAPNLSGLSQMSVVDQGCLVKQAMAFCQICPELENLLRTSNFGSEYLENGGSHPEVLDEGGAPCAEANEWPTFVHSFDQQLNSPSDLCWSSHQVLRVYSWFLSVKLLGFPPNVVNLSKHLRKLRKRSDTRFGRDDPRKVGFFQRFLKIMVADILEWATPSERQVFCERLLKKKKKTPFALEFLGEFAPEVLAAHLIGLCEKDVHSRGRLKPALVRLLIHLMGARFLKWDDFSLKAQSFLRETLLHHLLYGRPLGLERSSRGFFQKPRNLALFRPVLTHNYEIYGHCVVQVNQDIRSFLIACFFELQTVEPDKENTLPSVVRGLINVCQTYGFTAFFRVVFSRLANRVGPEQQAARDPSDFRASRVILLILDTLLEFRWSPMYDYVLQSLSPGGSTGKPDLSLVFAPECFHLRMLESLPEGDRLICLRKYAQESDFSDIGLVLRHVNSTAETLESPGYLKSLGSQLMEGSQKEKLLVIQMCNAFEGSPGLDSLLEGLCQDPDTRVSDWAWCSLIGRNLDLGARSETD